MIGRTMKTIFSAVVVVFILGLSFPVEAQQILDFESKESPKICLESGIGPVADGYGGFNWSNFYAAAIADPAFSETGIKNGSGDCVAFNGGGRTATMWNVNPFVLNSGYFSSGWANTMWVKLTGFLGQQRVWTHSLNVDQETRVFFKAEGRDLVDRVVFEGLDPVDQSGAPIQETHFVMDDLDVTVTPEPATVGLLLTGLLGIGYVARRKKEDEPEA